MKNRLFLKIITILFIALIYTAVFTYINYDKNKRLKVIEAQHIENLKIHYKLALRSFKLTSETIVESLHNDVVTIGLLTEYIDASFDKRTQIRQQLYDRLKGHYKRMQKRGILQFHFLMPNNVTLLRMHKPSKFDDDLTDFKFSYRTVNALKIPLSGLEQGKTAPSFRNVNPLFNLKGRHIGAVDISFAPEVLQKNIYEVNHVYSDFIIKKEVFSKRSWERNDENNYQVSIENDDYIQYLNSNNHAYKELIEPFKKEIASKMSNYETFSLHANLEKEEMVIAFLPIENTQKQVIAYLVSYSNSEIIYKLLKDFYIVNIIVLLVLLSITYFMYRSRSYNQELKKLQKELLTYNDNLEKEVEKQTEIANKERDKALKIAEYKSEFLANMSHEIRTPLNAILGFINILKEERLAKKPLEYIHIIDASSQSLLQIIEDILDFSKIESGKLEIDKIDFDTRRDFELMFHLFTAKAKEKNLSLSLHIDENLPQIINTDPLRVKQIMCNLLSNAIKFTQKDKSILLNIAYKKNCLTVSVKDEGRGIAKDKLEYIFTSFSQEDTSTTREYGGTGLGLSISTELVKLLGGKLQVKSELGVGSEFHFSIPVTIGTKEIVKKNKYKAINFKGKKILLVEDNEANQMFMQIVFKKLMLKCAIANDGLEAIEAFKNSKYDAILMDENMPNMNGIQATKEILKIEQAQNLEHTPIIALTANALKGDKEKFLSAGMDQYITKPVNQERLSKVLALVWEEK